MRVLRQWTTRAAYPKPPLYAPGELVGLDPQHAKELIEAGHVELVKGPSHVA